MKKLTSMILTVFLFFSCGPREQAKRANERGNQDADEAKALPSPKPLITHNNFEYSTNNYPVTLCGEVYALSKSKNTEFILENNSLKVLVLTNAKTDKDVLETLGMVRNISPHRVTACLSGLNLPLKVGEQLVFEVEKGAIAIASGGVSVSN